LGSTPDSEANLVYSPRVVAAARFGPYVEVRLG
jgi:hypothetical protein